MIKSALFHKRRKTRTPAPPVEGEKRLSFIIPAFEAGPFIGQCLSSIAGQRPLEGKADWEVLVGIDGCPSTRKALEALEGSRPWLRILWFPDRNGPYIVRNTLAYQAKGEYLAFFDADDVMMPGFASWAEKGRASRRLTIYPFIQTDALLANRIAKRHGADGVFGIPAKTFRALGGFLPWPMGADSELRLRAKRARIACARAPQPMFYRRKHPGCLTVRCGTGTPERQAAVAAVEALKGQPIPIWVDPKMAPFEELGYK